MPLVQRIVFVAMVAAAAAALGCRSGERGVCPEGMSLVKDRSASGKAVWCKSQDGKTARWIQYHPGEEAPSKRRQSCGFADGRPQGKFSAWHPAGQPWIEGMFERGVKEGTWIQWDRDGMKVAEGVYRGGKLVAGAPVGMAAVCETLEP